MRISILALLLLLGNLASSQGPRANTALQPAVEEEVHWLSFEEAVSRNEKTPKKILIDIYTKWCGWCKVMDANTYKNPLIVKYLNENYYSVKLDAEIRDTIHFTHKGAEAKMESKIFVFRPEMKANELALSLLNGKMGYPSTVFMDENYSLMTQAIQGYKDAPFMEMVLKYFGENTYKTVSWENFQKEFKSQLAPASSSKN